MATTPKKEHKKKHLVVTKQVRSRLQIQTKSMHASSHPCLSYVLESQSGHSLCAGQYKLLSCCGPTLELLLASTLALGARANPESEVGATRAMANVAILPEGVGSIAWRVKNLRNYYGPFQ